MRGFVALARDRALAPAEQTSKAASSTFSELGLSCVLKTPVIHIWASPGLVYREDGEGGASIVVGDLLPKRLDYQAEAEAGLEPRAAAFRRVLEGWRRSKHMSSPEEDEHHVLMWDASTSSLVASRDHLGVRPLFHASGEGFVVVASALRLLTAVCPPAAIESETLVRFVLGDAPADGRTVWQGLHRTPPGARLLWRPGEPLSVRGARSTPRPTGVATSADPADHFRRLFEQAVSRRLATSDATACMLSGGLDSTAIAVVAEKIYARRHEPGLRTLSRVYDETPELSERRFIEAALATGRYRSELLDQPTQPAFEGFEAQLEEQGGLFLAPGLYMGPSLYHVARSGGAAVLLDGHGGDEAVSYGWGRLIDLAQAHRWAKLWGELKGVAPAYGLSPGRMFSLYVLRYSALRPLSVRAVRGFNRLKGRSGAKPALLAPHQAVPEPKAEDGVVRPDASEESRQHYRKISDLRQVYGFEILDAAASAAGVSPMYPFWDRSLLQFCLDLDPAYKLVDGYGRFVLRLAVPELPDLVRWRRDKLDFSPHLAAALMAEGGCWDTIVAKPSTDPLWDYVNPAEAKRLVARLGRDGLNTPGDAVQALWRLGALARFLGNL